jgi:hypothetical protein
MPDVEQVVTALQQALGELGKSQSTAAVAHAGAVAIEAETTGARLLGIAAGIKLLRERLERVRQMQTEVASVAKGTVATVQRVTADMSPADVISTLTPAVQQMDAASSGTTAILIEVNAATVRASASLKGGKPEKMLGLLNDVDQGLTHALAKLEAAKARTEETIAEARQMGNFPVGMAAA